METKTFFWKFPSNHCVRFKTFCLIYLVHFTGQDFWVTCWTSKWFLISFKVHIEFSSELRDKIMTLIRLVDIGGDFLWYIVRFDGSLITHNLVGKTRVSLRTFLLILSLISVIREGVNFKKKGVVLFMFSLNCW